MKQKPVVLMILDGYGLNDNPEANAIAMANTPVVSGLMESVLKIPRSSKRSTTVK